MKKNNTAEKTIRDAERITKALQEGTEKSLRAIVNETIANLVMEEEDKSNEDEQEDGYSVEDVNTEDVPVVTDDNGGEDSKVDEPENGEGDEASVDDGEEGSEEGGTDDEWSDFEQYKVGDNDYDFTGVDGDEILKVYNKLGDDDQIFVKKEDDGTFMCVESSNNHYFSILDDSMEPNLSYLIRCNNGVTNCDTCESSNKCTKCLNDENYKLVDNGAFCEELSSKKIYWDESLEQYKYCTYKDPKCSKCQSSLDSNEKLVCEKCEELYALKHDNNNEVQCSLKTDLDSNSEYYTNDSGINYYSCSNSLFNEVSNCKECSNKNSCNRCQESYKLVNDNKDCMLQSDIDGNIIYYNPNTNIYTPCSELISLCYKCDSETTCTDCGEEGQLEENDSCISNELVENHNYFKDETINKYVSCSIIENCVTCTSSTICISCKDGYNVNNNICQIISSDEDKKLTTGAIIGIVFGCLGFLLVVAGVVYYLMNKVLKKKEINTIEPEEKIEAKEYREKTEEAVKTTKRSIHNVENK